MDTRIVLVRPHYAGNIGSAVRVAANFGVRRVILVAPLCSTEEHEFVKMAMGGQEHVDVTSAATVDEAVAPTRLVVATTSGRTRDPRPLHTPSEIAAAIENARPDSLALVFGPERGGLSAEEIRSCQLLLSVPTNADFPVLNLAQAVAVTLAILPLEFSLPSPRSDLDLPAAAHDFQAAIAHLSAALLETGYLDAVNPARVEDQLRRFFARATPSARELAILRGIASHISYLHRRPTRG